jgi:hypothetical protein
MRYDENYMGKMGDICHWYYWQAKADKNLWGEYVEDSYNFLGGKELLRSQVEKLQDKYRQLVSFYFIPDRYSNVSRFASEVKAERAAGIDQDGKPQAAAWEDAEGYYQSCCESTAWMNHFIDLVGRSSHDLKLDCVYLDVFPLGTNDAICWSKTHGHEIPSNPRHASETVLKRVRNAVPATTAIWGENVATDTESQYWDGNINYSYLSLEEYFAPSLGKAESARSWEIDIDIYRYLFPGVKQILFPVGIDGERYSPIKEAFWNGSALMQTTWWLFPDDVRVWLEKAIQIERDYSDCLNSAHPEHMVATLRGDVLANVFPGNGRTLITLFNSSAFTVKGETIAVDHTAGDEYYDLWNGVKLHPRIRGGRAYISVRMDPDGLGFVLRKSFSSK